MPIYPAYQYNTSRLDGDHPRRRPIVKIIDQIYIDGAFVTPHGTEMFDLYNPATGQAIGQVQLGDAIDTRAAIAAARRAFPSYSRTAKAERIAILNRLAD